MRVLLPFCAGLLLAMPLPVAAQALDWSRPAAYDIVWDKPAHGWDQFVAQSTVDARSRQRVVIFVGRTLSDAWSLSDADDGYKPLRDLIAELRTAGESLGADRSVSDKLIYDAMYNLDRFSRDAVPDQFYESLKDG